MTPSEDPTGAAESDFARAVDCHRAGQLDEAVGLYERVLAADPGHAEAHRLLGLLSIQRGQTGEAERRLREAIRLAPDSAKAYDNLAVVLHAQKRDDEAMPALRKAVELAPANELFLVNLGNLLGELNRRAEAIDAFRRASAAAPRNADIHQRLASELLRAGDAAGALRHLDLAIEFGGPNATFLSLKAVALGTVGDADGFNALMDFDRLVVCRHIGEAHGAASLEAFNQSLAAIVAENSLHEDHTTINGLDSAEMLGYPNPATAALRRFVYGEIEARLRTLPASHPFAAMAPRKWTTKSWGVKMWRTGYQETHIHHKAWLSGVYYVQLPEVVRKGQKGNAGWIEFGRGPDDLSAVAPPAVRLIQPIEGMLITFPSYMWHRTVPFEGKRDRISIAFDVTRTA